MTKNMRVAVIGGGVLGLAVARSLAMEGAEVSVFERSHIGAGTSTTTFAWINSNGKNPESYHRLNAMAMQEHVKLQQNASTVGEWLIQSGTYEWTIKAAEEQKLAKRVDKLLQLNYPVKTLSHQELAEKLPEIRINHRAGKIYSFPSESLLWPSVFLSFLWSEARKYGARLFTRADVTDIQEDEQGAKLITADGQVWQGDRVVVATGRWSQELMACLDIKLAMIDANQPNKIACGFLAQTSPLLVQPGPNLITPELNVRPEGGGRLLLQAPDLDHFANPAAPPALDGYIGQEFLNRLRRLFANTESAKIERISVGQRSRPADGLPAVGYVTEHKKIYLMVTHSGMTLAPLLGQLAAHEMLTGTRSELLADFSPGRLLGKSAADFPAFSTLHFPAAQ